MIQKISPVHPGIVLLEDYLKPLGISRNEIARAMRVPVNRISEICKGTRSITADTAIRLSKAIGTTPEFWMNLQVRYDLDMAQNKSEAKIAQEVTLIDLSHHALV
jgi:addiction module HigA family antidote